jgi:selenocysteine lyase/cysteine desulfurase
VKNLGVKLVQIPMPAPVRDQAQIIQLVSDHLTPRTRICSFSHVDTITGLQMPLKEISELTRPREIFLVCDGAQAPGMLQVDVKKLGVDTYASSSHKWLLAPKGSGLLFIRKEMQEKIQPLPFTSGYQAYTGATGTRNVVNVLGHGMAIDFHHAIGSKQVEARCRSLSGHLRNRLSENSHLTLLTPTQPELATGLVSFRLKKSTAGEVFTRLQKEHNILVKVVAKPEYNALRFSTHLYNNEEEVERTSKAIEGILKS